jgi:prepilin-type N-terminal cleavage/methylation domain-containing protein
MRPAVPPRGGFTLVEMLVAMAVMTLLLTFVFQMLSGTTATINASNKQMDTALLARIVLDRFGNDFSGALFSNGATALYYSDPGNAGNSALGFVSASRARGPTTAAGPWTTDVRSAIVGYRIRSVLQNVGRTATANIPSLNRGDGRLTFSVRDAGQKATYNLWDVFGSNSTRMPNDLISGSEGILNWQIIANGIFRMHISFILDDGRVVQTPPSYQNFFANGGTGSCVPLAVSAEQSADLNRRYVKGLIVGVAVLDETTRNLAYSVDNTFWTTVAGKIGRPSQDGETPVEFWNARLATLTSSAPNSADYLFPPVRQSLRFYERFYSVSP